MTDALRVAHVCATAGVTGVEAHLLTLLPSFAPDRVRPVMFVPGEGPLVERLRSRGVPVEFGAPSRKLAFPEARALAGRWRNAFDVVHAHGPRALFWAARAAREARVPIVATVHELRWQTLPPGLRRMAWVGLEGMALRSADRVVTVSEASRRALLVRWPGLAGRTRTVHASAPLLLDPERIPLAQPGRREGGPFRLVTVGRYDWVKGYDLLLPALAELTGRGVDWTLQVVGHGVLERELRERAARLGIGARITWNERGVDVPACLAASHAFVTTTRAEMFGIAVLEALACGLPVLATAVGSIPELVTDGEVGELLPFEPAGDLPARVASRLVAWWNDPSRMAAWGAAARRRASSVFPPAAFAAGTEAVYREIVRHG